jgi:large subunit ribosomal protein L24
MGFKFKKNDRVKVISGKFKGTDGKSVEGKIIRVIAEDNRVVVEGVHKAKKHMKPSRQNEKGGILEKEMPIHISNLMLVSPKSGQPVKTRKVIESGKRVRVEKKSGKSVD